LRCSCCFDCLVEWSLSKIKELQLQLEDTLPCIISSCQTSFKIEQILPKLPLQHREKINQALFSVYLNKAPDIRRCPNNKCSYAGILAPTFSCPESLECAECGANWKYKDNTKIWKNASHEIFSFLWKQFKAKKCPHCSIAIQKNGGCDHMICQRCKHEFCWICSTSAPRHNQFYHFVDNIITRWLHRILICLMIFFLLRWLYLWNPVNYLIKRSFACITFLLFGWPHEILESLSLGLLVNILLRVCLQYYSKLFNPYKVRRLPEKQTIINRRNIIETVLSLMISYFIQDYVEISKSNLVKLTIALVIYYGQKFKALNHMLIRMGCRKRKIILMA